MNNFIRNISKPIDSELNKFNLFFNKNLESNVKIINHVVSYIVKMKGKQLRPILCILSSRINGSNSNDRTYLSSSIVEILHVATLLHDDVVDEANLRRGWPSINKIWKNKLSILVGDYMFSVALISTAKLNDLKSIDILSNLSKRLSEGEILQIEKSFKKDMDEDTYFKMISDKTASLISASCYLGFLSTSDNEEGAIKMKKFGEYLGIAYQLKDDLFDVCGNILDTGKPSMLDVKKNMLTLPYIKMLSSLDDEIKLSLVRKLKSYYLKRNLTKLKQYIVDSGAIDYTKNKIEEYSNLAIRELDDFDDSVYKKTLIDIVNFNKERKY
ncbi:MAG: polyprenyl synthetase [Candidatus Marinimicrobia bacterium]|nr:polyprenyl synthetase [Candidatus Neomarinimicrobiota bacterium]|tara:strand:+ start:1536 stop:2516 length:981 start_codon:yes stop_codon:yes gene_type:complete